MEVGIEECLHIEFEYDKQKYNLQDIIIGKVYFLLVRIKIKHMELNIIRREQAGSGDCRFFSPSWHDRFHAALLALPTHSPFPLTPSTATWY